MSPKYKEITMKTDQDCIQYCAFSNRKLKIGDTILMHVDLSEMQEAFLERLIDNCTIKQESNGDDKNSRS